MTEQQSALPNRYRYLSAALLLVGWWSVVAYTPSSVFFRDSGEFILAAFYLDIVHPPGYPLYAQLSNLLALIPGGPIAWRVHLFSGLAACVLLFLTGITTFRLLNLTGSTARGAGKVRTSFSPFFLSILAPLWMIGSPAFLRGALTAEGYVLHGIFLLLLLNCFISYRLQNDLRWLIGASFLAGLSLGNHISGVLSIAPVALLVLLDIRHTARAIIPGLVMGVLGLSVYGYLPARSLAEPPLNTGSPQTQERLLAHITDARDRLLRPTVAPPLGSNITPETTVERVTRSIQHDLRTLCSEISPLLASGALLGLLILLVRHLVIGIAVIAILGGNLGFFSGWDPDPWVISLAVMTVLFSVFVAGCASTLKRPPSRAAALALLLVGVIATTPHRDAPFHLKAITEFSAAQRFARADADRLPQGAPFITEASWFIARYLHTIEGYRDDLLPVYQPSLIFPQLFAPLDLTLGDERLVATAEGHAPLATAHTTNLDRYIDAVSKRGKVFFEPTIELNARLRALARLEANGSRALVRGEPHVLEAAYVETIRNDLRALRAAALNDPRFFGADTQQYLETMLTYNADLLRITGHPDASLTLIDGVCLPNLPPCSITVDLNRALYLTDLDRIREATEVILAAALREPGARTRLIPNLQIALSRLAPEEIEELSRNPLHGHLIQAAGY